MDSMIELARFIIICVVILLAVGVACRAFEDWYERHHPGH